MSAHEHAFRYFENSNRGLCSCGNVVENIETWLESVGHIAKEITLSEARTRLQSQLSAGAVCPCCSQFAKVYKRKLNSSMAHSLLVLHREGKDGWIHAPSFLHGRGVNRSNDVGLLVHWGLIEAKREEAADGGKYSGWWRVTERGRDFANDKIRVPKFVFLFNQKALRLSDVTIDIRSALGERFNYNELMSA